MEQQITAVGTILLGAFYSIGYLLNQHSENKDKSATDVESLNENQSEFLTSLSSTASQSTSLNILLWERIAILEDLQEKSQNQIEMLILSNQQKDQQIADFETQIQDHTKIESS